VPLSSRLADVRDPGEAQGQDSGEESPSTEDQFPGRFERTDAFHRLPPKERRAVLDILQRETTGGFLLLLAAATALLWANIAPDSYDSLTEFTIGPEALNLDLSLATWAKDGLLAIFFLVVGLELKRELTIGELSNPAESILPMVAAVCGMVVPCLIYVVINTVWDGDTSGWAIPAATDIAFALAVLAVIGSALPTPLRAFLLTLAVVDDLLAILIIAIFFTAEIVDWALLASLAGLGVYFVLQQLRVRSAFVYIPLGLAIWALMHESGIHATIAGVAIGLLTRVTTDPGEAESPAERVEHRVRPYSSTIAVPVFALMAAGVTVNAETLNDVLTSPIGIGIIAGLVIGKPIGVAGGTWITVRYTNARLAPGISWSDIIGVGLLAGIGFTVSLLITELAFEGSSDLAELGKTGVLLASLLSALLAALVLVVRNRSHKRRRAEERGQPSR
jgi:NhaA family Na+:H+ antiporter